MSDFLLELEGLSLRGGSVEALRGISLHVREGELVALLGPNGAGKSSLLCAVSGLRRGALGRVRWQGEDILGAEPEQILKRGLAHVPAGGGLFPDLSVRDHLELALDGRRVPAKARAVERARVLELFPALGTRLREAAERLELLAQRQLALARALLCRPRLLLLDEPSAGLPGEELESLFESLARIHAEGTSLLLAEQNVYQSLAIADRAYVMEFGRVSLSGAAGLLLRDPRVVPVLLGG